MDDTDTYLVSVSEDYDDFPEIETEDKLTTRKIIQSAVRSLDDFLKRGFAREARCVEDLVTAEKSVVSSVLGKFYMGVRKENGDLYAKPSLKVLKFGLQKHFLKIRADDIIKDVEFKECNNIFQKVLATIPDDLSGNLPCSVPIIPADIDRLYSSPLFDKETPQGLQNRVLFEFMYYFGKTERNYLRSMQKNHIEFKCDDMGNRYAELNRINQVDDKLTVSDCLIFEIPGDERCPLSSLEKYMNLLQPNLEDLWQRPKDYLKSYGQDIWYDSHPLGKNTLGSMMGMFSKKAGLSQVYANKCIRTTSIDNLKRNGMQYHDIMAYVNERCYNSPKRFTDIQRSKMAYVLHQSLKQLRPVPGTLPNVNISRTIKKEPQSLDYEAAASCISSGERRENLPACKTIIIRQGEGQNVQRSVTPAINSCTTAFRANNQVQNNPQQIIFLRKPPAGQGQIMNHSVTSATAVYGQTTGNLNPLQGIGPQVLTIRPKGPVYSGPGHITQEVSSINFQGQDQIGQSNILPNTVLPVVSGPKGQDGNKPKVVKSTTVSVPGQKKIVIVSQGQGQIGQKTHFLPNNVSPAVSVPKGQDGNLHKGVETEALSAPGQLKIVIAPQGQGQGQIGQQIIPSTSNSNNSAYLSPSEEKFETHIETVDENGQRMIIPKPKHIPIVNLPTITMSKTQKIKSKDTRDKELKNALALLNSELLKMNSNPRQQEIKRAINLLKDEVQSLPKNDKTQPIIIGTTTPTFLKILPVKKQYGCHGDSENKPKSSGLSLDVGEQGQQDGNISGTGVQIENICSLQNLVGKSVDSNNMVTSDPEKNMLEKGMNCNNKDKSLENPQNFIKALPPGGYLSPKMFALKVPMTDSNKSPEVLFQAAPKGIQPFILQKQEEDSSSVTETPVFLQIIPKMSSENLNNSLTSSVTHNKCSSNLIPQATQTSSDSPSITLNQNEKSITLNSINTSSNLVSTDSQMGNSPSEINTHSQISNSPSDINTHSQISNSSSDINTHSQISNSSSATYTHSQISNKPSVVYTHSQISNKPNSNVVNMNPQLLQITPQATFQANPALLNQNTVMTLHPQNGITGKTMPRFLIQPQHIVEATFGQGNKHGENTKILVPILNQQVLDKIQDTNSGGTNKRKMNELNEKSSKKNCNEENKERLYQNDNEVEIKTELPDEANGDTNIVHSVTTVESCSVSHGSTNFSNAVKDSPDLVVTKEVFNGETSISHDGNDVKFDNGDEDLSESDELDDCTIELDIDNDENEDIRSSQVVPGEIPPGNECFTCGVCNMMFPSSQQCINHCMTHSVNDKKYKCGTCNCEFLHARELLKHTCFWGALQPVLACKICKTRLPTLESLTEHEKTHASTVVPVQS